jgi:hypothetical protein
MCNNLCYRYGTDSFTQSLNVFLYVVYAVAMLQKGTYHKRYFTEERGKFTLRLQKGQKLVSRESSICSFARTNELYLVIFLLFLCVFWFIFFAGCR